MFPVSSGCLSLRSQVGWVATQRIPHDPAITEGIKVDPAPLDPQHQRVGKCIIHSNQYLVAKQRIVEFLISMAGRTGKILPDLSRVGQTLPGRDPSGIVVPRPQAAVLCFGKPESHSDPDIRREPAVAGKVDVQVGKHVMRGEAAEAVDRPHKFLLKLVATSPRGTVYIGSVIISGVAVEVLQFHTEAGVPQAIADRRAKQNTFIGAETVVPVIGRTTIRAGTVIVLVTCSTLDLIIQGVDVSVAHTGPVVAFSGHIH